MVQSVSSPPAQKNSELKEADKFSLENSQNFPYELVSEIDESHFWFRVRNEILLKTIKANLTNWQNASFLEIGSGAATVLDFLSSSGMRNLAGCDINPLAIELSRKRLPQITFNAHSYEDFVSQGYKSDAVGMFDFIEHLEDDLPPLKVAHTVLNSGGKLFVSVPAHQKLYSNVDRLMGHYRRYTKESLEQSLKAAGFKTVKVEYVMQTMYPLVLLKRLIVPTPIPDSPEGVYWTLVKEVDAPSKPVNALLKAWLRAEYAILNKLNLPFGGSLIACATKD
jgi:2-polyprenyl-3-methyl-5-hydroxy-6-metoxy-1,4-benzoquinol methylase